MLSAIAEVASGASKITTTSLAPKVNQAPTSLPPTAWIAAAAARRRSCGRATIAFTESAEYFICNMKWGMRSSLIVGALAGGRRKRSDGGRTAQAGGMAVVARWIRFRGNDGTMVAISQRIGRTKTP